jgi:TPR repeat protein
MRTLAIVLLLFVGLGAAHRAEAGAREAAEAYNRGDFPGVLRACKAEAEAGDASCQNWLGILYSEGKGVKADPAEAVHWFRRAAEHGHGVAAFNLARALESGHGVKKDPEEAKRWARQAAEQGIPQA